jgi:hypothetical protein
MVPFTNPGGQDLAVIAIGLDAVGAAVDWPTGRPTASAAAAMRVAMVLLRMPAPIGSPGSSGGDNGMETGMRPRVRAMGERNIALARAAIDAFNRGDTEAIRDLAAPDFVVHSSQELPNPGNFSGFDGYEEWVAAWLEAWDDFRIEELETEALDDHHVLMMVRQVGRGQSSGLEITMDAAYLYEVGDDGKLVRFELHLTRESALGAVRPT